MKNSPVGKWFHSYKDGMIHWQGEVLSEPIPGRYVVETYSWLTGAPWSQQTVSVADMADWSFYETDEDMNEAYYQSAQHQARLARYARR